MDELSNKDSIALNQMRLDALSFLVQSFSLRSVIATICLCLRPYRCVGTNCGMTIVMRQEIHQHQENESDDVSGKYQKCRFTVFM